MTKQEFIRLVGVVLDCGYSVFVVDDYSDRQLDALVSALSALFEEVSWK